MTDELPEPRRTTPGEQRLIAAVGDFNFLGQADEDGGDEPISTVLDCEPADGGLPRPVTRITLTHYDNAVADEYPLTISVELEYRLTQDELAGLVSTLLFSLPKKKEGLT